MNTFFKYSVLLTIGFSSSFAWGACVSQSPPDNSIVATAVGDSCTNNVSITTTATGLPGFGMSDTISVGPSVSNNSVTLVNSATGTITTSGDGATGIHAEGQNAIIVNNGAIAVSGGSSPGLYADGINALGNNSSVTNSGSINVSGVGMFGVWFRNSTGGSFNNSNTGSLISSGLNGVGLVSSISLVSFINSGSISATGLGGMGVSVGIVDTFTNSGSITGTSNGVVVGGTVNFFNNAQGGNNSSPSTTALTYEGNLPTNYNIMINSATHYGQLAVTSPGLTPITNFGIFGAPLITIRTYDSVLSGTDAPTGIKSGAYDNMRWSLVANGAAFDLVFAGASLVGTQQSLVNSASALQGTYALQNAVLANSFSYDCSVFGANNVCISAGGRNTAVSAANGLNNTSALLIAAYRIKPTLRIGAYADQNLSVNNAGSTVNLGNNTPLIGLFGVWNERLDGTGTEVKVAAAYGQKNTTVNRQIVGLSEAGSGSSNLNSQGAQITAKYGFAVLPEVLVSPYVGVRYTQNNMGGYTESTSAQVTDPLTYSALNTNATTALAGVGAAYRFIPKATAFASAGVETDTNTSGGTYSASGVTGLTPVNFNPNPVKTRPTATLGAYYDIVKNQRIGITGIYRQESYQAISTTTVMATYTIGL